MSKPCRFGIEHAPEYLCKDAPNEGHCVHLDGTITTYTWNWENSSWEETRGEKMKHPELNIYLLEKTLTYIQSHPEEHEQSDWGRVTPCGTTMCFAGHAAELAGEEVAWEKNLLGYGYTYRMKDGRDIQDRAAELLGLNKDEEYYLFINSSNTDVRNGKIVQKIIDGYFRRD